MSRVGRILLFAHLSYALLLPNAVEAQLPLPSSSEPPTPVLLVPGWGDAADDLGPLAAQFRASGWSTARLSSLTFRDPVGSSDANAEEVAREVDRLLQRTGAARVDIVAHSMGGLAVREYLREAPGARVRRVVFLGTPHRGTVVAALAWGAGGREMVPGSPFLDRLNGEDRAADTLEWLAIRTPLDLRVLPGSSAILPGAINREICCPTHQGLLEDEETFQALRAFLREGAEGLGP